jgi:hypothetical protein
MYAIFQEVEDICGGKHRLLRGSDGGCCNTRPDTDGFPEYDGFP